MMMAFCMYVLGFVLILSSWGEEDGELPSFIGFMIIAMTLLMEVM